MSTPFDAKAGQLITYAQATAQQREQALAYLKQRLRLHFPVLAAQTWRDALTLFQPELLIMGEQVQFTGQNLSELAQYLSDSPELPLLDPPLYGPPTLHLAQRYLHAAELAVWALPELEVLEPTGSQRLYALVSLLAHGNHVAEQVILARRWGLAVGRPLPLGVPGGGASPGSREVENRLLQLRQVGSNRHS